MAAQHAQAVGAEAGVVFSANFIAAMCSQPIYGFVSDRSACASTSCGWWRAMHPVRPVLHLCLRAAAEGQPLLGAAVGGIYLGVTFIAGSYAIESYVDRIGRRHGFEYSRVRMCGSLGFASAAMFSGRLYNINPGINFFMASGAGLLMLAMLALWKHRHRRWSRRTGQAGAPADALSLLRDPTSGASWSSSWA
jgi:OHS family lactose permease-like MFS transporter